MKRKLIETSCKSLIVCDNLKCDYEIPFSVENKDKAFEYINMPCPKCGDNLLTEKDFLVNQKLTETIDWINKWFSWITFFYSKKSWSKRQTISVHIHNGIKIENKQD